MMTDYNDRQTESGLVEGGQYTDSLTDNPFVSDKKVVYLVLLVFDSSYFLLCGFSKYLLFGHPHLLWLSPHTVI